MEVIPHWLQEVDYLCFSGGGIKCLAYSGALLVLEEIWKTRNGLHCIQGAIGSSGGALFAFLIVAGYSANEIYEKSIETDFSFMIQDMNFAHLGTQFGINDKKGMIKHMEDLLINKGFEKSITLKEFAEKTGKEFKVSVNNVTTFESEIWDAISRPSCSVVTAIVTSMSIPLLCVPTIELNEYEKENYYIDGGCIANVPFDLFPSSCTLCFRIVRLDPPTVITGFADYLFRILTLASSKLEQIQIQALSSSYRNRIVAIDAGNVRSIDFALSKRQIVSIIQLGALQMFRFAKKEILTLQCVESLLTLLLQLNPCFINKTANLKEKTINSEEPLQLSLTSD